jgi:hypothetical protein
VIPIEFMHPHVKATFSQRELGRDYFTLKMESDRRSSEPAIPLRMQPKAPETASPIPAS